MDRGVDPIKIGLEVVRPVSPIPECASVFVVCALIYIKINKTLARLRDNRAITKQCVEGGVAEPVGRRVVHSQHAEIKPKLRTKGCC